MVKIDKKKCVGCSACVMACPEGFELSGGTASVKNPKADCIDEAIESCPVDAISR